MLEAHQLPFVLAGVVLMTLQPLLVTMSQNSEGKLDYNSASSTLFTEGLKIVISSSLLFRSGQHQTVKLEVKELLQFSIPAIIYFVNNNLVFIILGYVNPTTFQLLSQLKIVFTGLLFRVFLRRTLTKWQYLAIWQLTCGCATSHIPLNAATSSDATSTTSLGSMLSVASCLLSAMGGIYTEKLLKGSVSSSIHWQNIQLYGWGIIFNFLGACISEPDMLVGFNLLKGFNFWACIVVLNNALNGLAISAILKYADNIARVYAHAAAMMVTMVVSVFLFGQSITPQLGIAVAMVAASALQYNLKESSAQPEPVKTAEPARTPGLLNTELADKVGVQENEETMMAGDSRGKKKLAESEAL